MMERTQSVSLFELVLALLVLAGLVALGSPTPAF